MILFILHFSVRSQQKNIDKLITLLTTFSEAPDIFAISETKLTYGQPQGRREPNIGPGTA